MNATLESILAEINHLLDRREGLVEAPFHYLDPDVVSYLFQELTGLSEYPDIPLAMDEDQGAGASVGIPKGKGRKPPLYLVYKAMIPELNQRVPRIDGSETLTALEGRFARIQGLLQSTRFPDGRLNLEIAFGDVRGVLFYTEDFFSSMLRPLLAHDRFHALHDRVEALVYVHGSLKKTIFYHQSYGDNQEHAWVPLVPVVIENRSQAGGEQPDGL
jgi:hypothetical protein